MVIGFDRFREAFRDFAENYIVIGRFVRGFEKGYCLPRRHEDD